jgi:EAL domain-containing protein (putative c-di-GMP-specific phosphodiesterase class I)
MHCGFVCWVNKTKAKFSSETVCGSGLNENLDYAVLEMALASAAQREVATGEKSRIAINIDVGSLVAPQFIRKAKKIIALSELNPELIEIELTEHSIIDDPKTVIQKMNQLIDIGVSFVLDDFGTGFSSLTHLHRLPVKKIKIDRSFVSKIGNEKSSTLIQSIISTARLLGMETTGEGAETHEHMVVLDALG